MEYKLVQVKRENLPAYSKLLSEVFTDTKKYTEQFLNWQYFENPAGAVVGFDVFYGDQLVAHYVTIPVIYTINNTSVKGLLSLNTATKKEHQGKGLFLKLANATYELAKQLEYKFVVGVANQNSSHGFINKLGFDLISKLDVKIYIGKVKHKTTQPNYFRALWNEELIKWRLNNPEGNYFYSANSVFSGTHLPFFKSLITTNNIYNIKLDKLKINLLKIAIGLNLNKPSFAINLPDKFKPSPLNLIFKNLSGEDLKITSENFYFETIDFDAY